MGSDIRLLEDLVNKAVDRLKQLAEERNDLQQELEGLRHRLEQIEQFREDGADGAGGSDDGDAAGWRVQREQVLTVLRDTLDELRSD